MDGRLKVRSGRRRSIGTWVATVSVLNWLGFAGLGCRVDSGGDARTFAPARPNNSATLGTRFDLLPRGKMYSNVPGSDLSALPARRSTIGSGDFAAERASFGGEGSTTVPSPR